MTHDDLDRIAGLDQLEVPAPADGFWDELHERLVAAAASRPAQTPLTVDVVRSPRRRLPYLAAAAVIVVVAGLVAVTLLRSSPSVPSDHGPVRITDPMAIDLDPFVTGPTTGAPGSFTVFDLDRLPAGWTVTDAGTGTHLIEDSDPAHYVWNARVATGAGVVVLLSASRGDDEAPTKAARAVTVGGAAGFADGDLLQWNDAAGVRLTVISPGATADELVQIANSIPLIATTDLQSPAYEASDPTSSATLRLGGIVDGVEWHVISNSDAAESLSLTVGGAVVGNVAGPTTRPVTERYSRVITGLGDQGAFLHGLAPSTVANVRVVADGATITLPVARDDVGTSIYAIPIPAGLVIRDIEFLTQDGVVAHRDEPPVALTPSSGTSAHQELTFDPPTDGSANPSVEPSTTVTATTTAATTTAATTTAPTPAGLVEAPLTPAVACDSSRCPSLAESELGVLVAYDAQAATLTWYEDTPRVVPIRATLDPAGSTLVAVGPADMAYLSTTGAASGRLDLVAVDTSGSELERSPSIIDAAAPPVLAPGSEGLLAYPCCTPPSDVPPELAISWIYDSERVSIMQYPFVRLDGSAWYVSMGDGITWHVPASAIQQAQMPLSRVRGDGGVVVLLTAADGSMELVELLRDTEMSIHRYPVPAGATQPTLSSDGSLIVRRGDAYVRLSPPNADASPLPVSRDNA